MSAPLLEVEGLRVATRIDGAERPLVTGVDLTIAQGETIGIVGESGSGKSLTARALIGLLPDGLSADGSVRFDDVELLGATERELAWRRGTDISLLMQDPFTMLNPLLRCGAHITEHHPRGPRRGRRKRQAELRDEAVQRLAEVGIDDPSVAERFPFQLSGGMRQRVAIAAALARNPRLLIADEPTTALDVTTQREILELIASLQRQRGMSMALITHDLRVAFAVCDRVYVLYAGEVLEVAPGLELEREPLHPYAHGLLLSEPSVTERYARLPTIGGAVPRPEEVAGSCAFAPRCGWAIDTCHSAKPPLAPVGAARATRCARLPEIRADLRRASRRPDAAIATTAVATVAVLEITGLTKTFLRRGRRDAEVLALRDVSLIVGLDESVGLVGESGSGKTTLGRCVVGLETPTEGAIQVTGIDVADYTRLDAAARRTVRRSVQYVFQDPYSSLNPARTIGATLIEALEAANRSRAGRDRRVAELLARVGLPGEYAQRKPVALSGGERQRVAIARALAVEPKLIVCDEPVSALDVSVQAQILNLLRDVREETGTSFLFISHDLAVVRQVVDRVYVLYRGGFVEDGPIDLVLDEPRHPYTRALVASVPGGGPTETVVEAS